MNKRIAVVGAGAVGGYLGGNLARTGNDITLIDPWPEHVEAIRAQGLRLSGMTEEESYVVQVPAMHLTEVQAISRHRPIDIAIVSCKSYDTEWMTGLIKRHLAPTGFVVSAQNSINEEAVAGVVGWGRTVGCMIGNNFAVDLFEPGAVRRTMPRDFAVNSIVFGEVHGRITPRVEELRDLFAPIDGSATTANLWGVRWAKLCVNGMRNGVSAATGMSGNERDSHPEIRRVVIRLAGEAVKVGLAMGLSLDKVAGMEPETIADAFDGDAAALAEIEAHIEKGTRGQARSNLQRPSMAQDIQKGRRTEIDEINGFIARKGAEAGCPAPTHEKLAEIVRMVEKGDLAPSPDRLLGNF